MPGTRRAEAHAPRAAPPLPEELWSAIVERVDSPREALRLGQVSRTIRHAADRVAGPHLGVVLQCALDRRRSLGTEQHLLGFIAAHRTDASFVRAAGSLRDLDLSYHNMSAPSLRSLVVPLSTSFSGVTCLDLSGNALVDTCLCALTTLSSLRALRLGDNVLQGSFLYDWPNRLPHLSALDLSDTPLIGPRLFHLIYATRLVELRLNNTGLRSSTLGRLTALSRLQRLEVDRNNLGDRGATVLHRLTALVSLSVADNRVGPDFLAGLHALARMTRLHLGGSALGAEGTLYLERLTQIVALDVRGAATSPSCLALGLRAMVHLHDLDLGFNRVGAAQLRALTAMSVLSALGLAGTHLSEEACEVVAAATGLTRLDLSGNVLGGGHLASLSGLVHLADLDLHATRLAPAHLRHLRPMRQLTRLDLGGTRIGPQAVTQLAAWPQLTELGLASSRMTDMGLTSLVPLRRIRRLHLEDLHLSQRALPALIRMDHLDQLYLADNPLLLRALGAGPWLWTPTAISS